MNLKVSKEGNMSELGGRKGKGGNGIFTLYSQKQKKINLINLLAQQGK